MKLYWTLKFASGPSLKNFPICLHEFMHLPFIRAKSLIQINGFRHFFFMSCYRTQLMQKFQDLLLIGEHQIQEIIGKHHLHCLQDLMQLLGYWSLDMYQWLRISNQEKIPRLFQNLYLEISDDYYNTTYCLINRDRTFWKWRRVRPFPLLSFRYQRVCKNWKCFRTGGVNGTQDRSREAVTCKDCWWRRRVYFDNELRMRVTSPELQVSSDSRFPTEDKTREVLVHGLCSMRGKAVSVAATASSAWIDNRLEHAPHVPLSGTGLTRYE
ncbi:hypothetical protein TcasGA2_TC001286 [Tribolium castaneum]|uniref:Uncharacterized protein n=1 Tax=Tribolium castaneum TaxID=7070 RepID=D6WBP9_TRICA|nr:hypothetical protein TcasGA2_TC001286 [Tribolium castaneum]